MMLSQACLVAVLSVSFLIFFHLYKKGGLNYHFKKHHPGECRHVHGLDFSSEDLAVTGDGVAFVSSGVNFPSRNWRDYIEANSIRGRIFLFNFKQPNLGARPLKFVPSKTFDPETFQPHGISVLEDKVKGEHLLYVVNHVKHGKDRVEKFRFIPSTSELMHLRFFTASTFLLTNDLAVLEEDVFYISNYLFFQSPFLSHLEAMLPLRLGGILLVNGNDVTESVPGLHGPNGLALSRDERFLYVALPLEDTLHVYERGEDNSVTLVQTVPEVHTWIDNLHLALSGDALLAGAHPIPYKMSAHVGNPYLRSPSSVLHLPLSDGLVIPENITEIFYDHGDLITASSVAHIHSGQLLIGSVLDKLVLCDLYREPAN